MAILVQFSTSSLCWTGRNCLRRRRTHCLPHYMVHHRPFWICQWGEQSLPAWSTSPLLEDWPGWSLEGQDWHDTGPRIGLCTSSTTKPWHGMDHWSSHSLSTSSTTAQACFGHHQVLDGQAHGHQSCSSSIREPYWRTPFAWSLPAWPDVPRSTLWTTNFWSSLPRYWCSTLQSRQQPHLQHSSTCGHQPLWWWTCGCTTMADDKYAD